MIKRALLSVSDKTGLIDFARGLAGLNVELISTGGTASALKAAGIAVKDVADVTGFPEIMDGRVKTLHPLIHGGLLAVRGHAAHDAARQTHAIGLIDLLVVNLYPFAQTLAKAAPFDEIIENIDVGGPAMIRAAAKNHESVTVVVDHKDYPEVLDLLRQNSGDTTLALRRRLAAKAFSRTAGYDAAIAGWLNLETETVLPDEITIGGTKIQSLRHGENPHQQAALYDLPGTASGIGKAQQLQGKDLSYNNVNDADAALNTVREFKTDVPACVIIKHANPCGVALGASLVEAYMRALACDPTSAFGGILAFNQKLDGTTAAEIVKLFTEVILVPEADVEARTVIAAKKNLRLLLLPDMMSVQKPVMQAKLITGGLLLQTADDAQVADMTLKVVSKRQPAPQEMRDLEFAFRVAKHVKSNAIVFAKNQATTGIGAGQMSRIDSARIAVRKGADAGTPVKGSVMASDAFFPFPDGIEAAAEAGATAIIQPGGALRDDEVVKAADEAGLAMVMTGVRHFRH